MSSLYCLHEISADQGDEGIPRLYGTLLRLWRRSRYSHAACSWHSVALPGLGRPSQTLRTVAQRSGLLPLGVLEGLAPGALLYL